MDYTAMFQSPIGPLHLASDGEALIGLWLENQKYYGATLRPGATPNARLPVFLKTEHWLDAYFSGNPLPPLPPLAPRGSAFRQAVWKLLLEIPLGQTSTYGAIAQALRANGIPAAPQAVGSAVGHNPISILIPCHRVLGADGSLTGYAGGLNVKRFLLELEGGL